MNLTHINEEGRARMVDVSEKAETKKRSCCNRKYLYENETLRRIHEGTIKKEMSSCCTGCRYYGCENTSHMIPMCHPIMITGCDISFNLDFENSKIDIKAVVKTVGQTGVEMEALTAVTVAALTIYDMCKAIDRDMVISEIMLVKKSGGKSGLYEREV